MLQREVVKHNDGTMTNNDFKNPAMVTVTIPHVTENSIVLIQLIEAIRLLSIVEDLKTAGDGFAGRRKPIDKQIYICFFCQCRQQLFTVVRYTRLLRIERTEIGQPHEPYCTFTLALKTGDPLSSNHVTNSWTMSSCK